MRNRHEDRVFVFGASGHAKVVLDIIERQGCFKVDFLVDDDPALKGRRFFGYDVLGGRDELFDYRQKGASAGIVAIGSNSARRKVAGWLIDNGFGLVTAIHPSAVLSRGVVVGDGTVLMAGTVVNADVVIGNNVIVNTGVTIDHDCFIGDGVHIAPGTTLCGTVHVGGNTFIGAGVTVIPNITIGSNVVVGAGATVVRNVPDGVQVMGTPARIVNKN
ncbi:MAG: acetyltransferase [Deltaproteobacteria bacterium]|nr:acetyltransferase [Deltaproteobacteria bacterium]TLN01159.1 MAG: acetyltransferase [bacterium]